MRRKPLLLGCALPLIVVICAIIPWVLEEQRTYPQVGQQLLSVPDEKVDSLELDPRSNKHKKFLAEYGDHTTTRPGEQIAFFHDYDTDSVVFYDTSQTITRINVVRRH